MLYIVSTPIGNLDDISLRQALTLLSSDLILAEDTRSAKILLDAIPSRFPQLTNNNRSIALMSYFKQQEFNKLPEIIELLKQGKNISLISESGTPLVSDPGYLLVKTVIKQQLPLTVIPGPSAIISAIVHSGFNPNPKHGGFTFLGFFPKKESEINHLIDKLKQVKQIFPNMIFVFYESPLRINQTITLLDQAKWPGDLAICRELSKKFEEVIRGQAKDLMSKQYRGEITLILS